MFQKLNARSCLSKEGDAVGRCLLLETRLFVYLCMLQCIQLIKEFLQ